MTFSRNVSLAPYTTFGIGGPASYFAHISSIQDLQEAYAQKKDLEVLVLGGGSNVLVSDQGFPGLVLFMDIKGINIISQDDKKVSIQVASGESWDAFVADAVSQGFWGIENLSHIPGKVGGIAIQNVGAYGQEASQVIESVEVFDTHTQSLKNLSKKECGFGYRTSIFNTTQKGRYIIVSITFTLQKNGKPQITYPDLQTYFEGIVPGLSAIREAVIEIRDTKFPHPGKMGSAGSFFKNTMLAEAEYTALEQKISQQFSSEILIKLQEIRKKFPQTTGIKIPTAFLLDICGLKGKTSGGAQVNPTQPLVIINKTGKATASDVLTLMKQMRTDIYQKTGITLTVEPELIGFTKSELEFYFSL